MRLVQMKVEPDQMPAMRSFYTGTVIKGLHEVAGCIFAGLIQSHDHPGECVSMTLWDNQAQATAYAASELYQGFRVKTREFLAGSTEWKVQLSPDLTLETVHDVEEPVVKSYAIEQFEDGKTIASDSAQLYVRIVALKVNHGKMDEFRNVFSDIILPSLRNVKGCRYAFLTEGDSEDEVLSVTIWRSVADATAYEASGMVEQFLDKLSDTFSGLYQWKMGLDKEQRDTLVTTEDVKVSHYEVITGETFRGF